MMFGRKHRKLLVEIDRASGMMSDLFILYNVQINFKILYFYIRKLKT